MKLIRIAGIALLALMMIGALPQTQATAAPGSVSNPPSIAPATGTALRLASQLYETVQIRNQIIARGGLDTVAALSAIAVDVTPRVGVSFAALTEAIGSVGGTVERQNIDSIRAHLSAPAILALAAKPETLVIDQAAAEAPGPLLKAVQQAGPVDAGVHAINADAWQAVNWQGAGVNVAVFDTDFTGIEDNYAGVSPGPYSCVKGTHAFTPDDTVQGNTGRTIGSEEVQALCATAPLASVYVVRLNGPSDMVNAITYVRGILTANNNRKLNIILSGMTSTRPQGPGDATAPDLSPASTFDPSTVPDGTNIAIATANNLGILWINAAGDYRNAHWSGPDLLANNGGPTALEPFYTPAVGSPETTNTFKWINSGGPITVMLRWTGNWVSAVQVTDFDLKMSCVDSQSSIFNVQSTNVQENGVYPFPRESLTFPGPQTAPVGDADCTVTMIRNSPFGQANVWIDLYVLSSQVTLHRLTGSPGQAITTSLPDEENAFTVGSFCTSTFVVDGTSSYGPLNNNPNGVGVPNPASTKKPDLVGPSAISNTFHTAGNCLTGFYGSASGAAHIAGEAAIYWGYLARLSPPSSVDVQGLLRSNNKNPSAATAQLGIGGGVAYMASVPAAFNPGTATPSPTLGFTRTPKPTLTPSNTGIPTATPLPNAALVETIAMYRPSTHTFYIRFANASGPADITISWGNSNTVGIAGDWNGDGFDTIGIYDVKARIFSLSDSNTSIVKTIPSFAYGIPGDQPIVGKWVTGATHDGVGVFRPTNGLIYLTQQFKTGVADAVVILGNPNDVGLGGHWLTTNNFLDTAGVYRPNNSYFYLTNSNCPTSYCVEFGNEQQIFGAPFDTPVTGDWLGTGHTGIGIFRVSNGYVYLKNDISKGWPNFTFLYGLPGDMPLAGHWLRGGAPPPPIVPRASATATESPAPSITATTVIGSFDG